MEPTESQVTVKGILKAPSKLREFIKSGHQFNVNGIDCYTAPPIILASDQRGMAVLSVPFMVEVKKEGASPTQNVSSPESVGSEQSGRTSISIANDTMFHSFILNDEQLAVLIEKLVHGA